MFVSTVILFNHESPLRPASFVTRKITSAVAEIAAGHRDPLDSRTPGRAAGLGGGVGLRPGDESGPAA